MNLSKTDFIFYVKYVLSLEPSSIRLIKMIVTLFFNNINGVENTVISTNTFHVKNILLVISVTKNHHEKN